MIDRLQLGRALPDSRLELFIQLAQRLHRLEPVEDGRVSIGVPAAEAAHCEEPDGERARDDEESADEREGQPTEPRDRKNRQRERQREKPERDTRVRAAADGPRLSHTTSIQDAASSSSRTRPASAARL